MSTRVQDIQTIVRTDRSPTLRLMRTNGLLRLIRPWRESHVVIHRESKLSFNVCRASTRLGD